MDDLAYRACIQQCAHLSDSLSSLDLDGLLIAAQVRGNSGDLTLIRRLIRARDGLTPIRITPAMFRNSVAAWRDALEGGLESGHLEKQVKHSLGGMEQVLDVLDHILSQKG